MGVFDTLGGLAQRANYALNPEIVLAERESKSRISTNEARLKAHQAQEERYRNPPRKFPSLEELEMSEAMLQKTPEDLALLDDEARKRYDDRMELIDYARTQVLSGGGQQRQQPVQGGVGGLSGGFAGPDPRMPAPATAPAPTADVALSGAAENQEPKQPGLLRQGLQAGKKVWDAMQSGAYGTGASAGFGPSSVSPNVPAIANGSASSLPRADTQEQYDAIQGGTWYIHPDGDKRLKPENVVASKGVRPPAGVSLQR